MKKITIPSSVESIGNCALDCCTSLVTVKILSTSLDKNESCLFCGCTSIDDSAFEVCQLFSAIRIPPSIHKIGDCVIAECELLSLIEFTSSELVTGKQVLIGIKGEIVTILKNLFKRNNEFKQINFLSPKTIFLFILFLCLDFIEHF